MKPIKVLSVFGTRPEAIKMAPLVLALRARPEFESVVCVTAQHRQMLDGVLACFGISADFDLDIMREGQTLSDITGRVLSGLGDVFSECAPDLVLVHGDTTTAFASALAAFYARIPVGHVEAGLRTFDRYSPFPEEMNRCMVSQLANLHFAPTASNALNLKNECITENVFVTGNTVIDAMKHTIGDGSFTDPVLKSLDFGTRRVLAMTCHRRENYGEAMENIFRAVKRLAGCFPDVDIVYPVHLSPYVGDTARKLLSGAENIHLIAPLDAMEMHRLMSKSYFVMTDSGGIQEEAPALGKPVLVMRRETERPEAVAAGTVKLAGVDEDQIFALASELLTDKSAYDRMAKAVNPYGDGNACMRIAEAILFYSGVSDRRPEDFQP